MDNKALIPGAIIIAALIIAGAFFLTRTTAPGSDSEPFEAYREGDIVITSVSPNDHILGNPNAPIVAVEFSDLECPFCKRFHADMHRVLDTYGKDGNVAWVYRHFPLPQLHPKAPKEAEATECAAELGGNTVFWDYLDKIFEITPSNNKLDLSLLSTTAVDMGLDQALFDECLESGKYAGEIEKDFNDAASSGGRGTPHTVFILKDPFSSVAEDVIRDFSEIYNTPDRPNTIVVSADKTKIAISGALNFDSVLKPLIDAILF